MSKDKRLRSVPPSGGMPISRNNINHSRLQEESKTLKMIYDTYVEAGFTAEQAMELTKMVLSNGLRQGK